MGSTNGKESCGRCASSTVIEATSGEDGPDHDPFEGGHIELDERELRYASAPSVLFGRLKRRLDEVAARFIYG